MRVLVVGGGGREHAIIKKLSESKDVTKIYACPGNGGISALAECTGINAADIVSVVEFSTKNDIGYVVVAPDDPLVLGMVDALLEAGIPCFGPDMEAAKIEGSKSFAKNLMKKYGIKTAAFHEFTESDEALEYLKNSQYPQVIKADGLALGKGVFIAQSFEEAKEAVYHIMCERMFGESGSRIVVEEFLTGPEVSVLAFTDGETIVPMVSSMDHKRAYDGDTGPNTGGMGTIAPNPYYNEETAKICMDEIFIPTIKAMKKEGCPFKGCLYFGLMLTENGPYVIEYNCRFGDPETQVVLPLLKTDLFEIMRAVTEGSLDQINIEFENKHTCCVIMASGGYPKKPDTGHKINGIFPDEQNLFIYHSGTVLKDEVLINSGGRVLGITAKGDSLSEARTLAYEGASKISFKNGFYRKDIGERAAGDGSL